MKKAILLPVLTLICTISVAQIDNLSNMSAEWIRSSARNAATDAADIVVYNPAGITSLADGLHINFSNQFMFRKPSHQYDIGFGEGTKQFEQQSADLFLPNLYATYKKDNWAIFTGAFMSGGGASMDYSEGSLTTDLIGMQVLMGAGGAYMQTKDASLKASSMYLTTTLGATFACGKVISFSMAGRHITAKNNVTSEMTLTASPFDLPDQPLYLDADYKAKSYGAVVAMNANIKDKVTLSARYETEVNLDFKTKTHKDDFGFTADGAESPRDLPAVMGLGAAFQATSKFKIYADYNYYFQENADWGNSSMLTNEDPLSHLAGNASAYAIAFEYKVADKLLVSAGGGYTDFDYSNKDGYYTNLGTFEVIPDNNYNFNGGFAFKANKRITVNAGYMYAMYEKDQKVKALMAQPLDVDVTINNSISIIAAGVNLSF
jgi:long-chain fatty acid transport protein